MLNRISNISILFLLTLIAMPIALLLGQLLLQNTPLALIELVGIFVGALLMMGVPGHVSAGKRKIPLRMLLTFVLMGGAVACLGVMPYTQSLSLVVRWGNAAIVGILFVLLVRLGANTAQIDALKLLPVGVIAYLAVGIALWAMDTLELNRMIFAGAIAFFVVIAFSLNGSSVEVGYAARTRIRPPARVMRGNRLLIAILMLLVAFVAAFDSIRAWATELVRNIAIGIVRIFIWLTNLLPMESVEGSIESEGSSEFFGMEAAEEPALFWQILERIFFVIAVLAILFLLYKVMRVAARRIKQGMTWLSAHFKRFAEAVGEDYQDERESLFDLAELKSAMEERAKRQLGWLLNREKRWEQMDGRERVRYLVRMLYRRAGTSVAHIESMTIRESSRAMGIGRAEPEALSALYEKARYSGEMPDNEEVEALRRAVK